MKAWFRNSSEARKYPRAERLPGEVLVNPGDKQIMTIAELVAMSKRGQDINAFERPVTWGMDDEDEGHLMVSVQDFLSLDFSERKEFADQHRQSVNALAKELDDFAKRDRQTEVTPSDSTTDESKAVEQGGKAKKREAKPQADVAVTTATSQTSPEGGQ